MIEYVLTALFIIVSLILSYQDIKEYHISLPLLYGTIAVFLFLLLFYKKNTLLNACIASITISLLFILVRLITNGNLGIGDIKFSVLCGLYTGLPEIIIGCLLASISGILFLLFMKFTNKKTDIKTKRIPFIPFMSIGCIIAKIVLVNLK